MNNTESTQQSPSQKAISGFPILPLDSYKNEKWSEHLNTRVQPTLYSHMVDNLRIFGAGNVQDLVRAILGEFFSGEIIPRSKDQININESIELAEALQKIETFNIEINRLNSIIVKHEEESIAKNLLIDSFKEKLETSVKQSETMLFRSETDLKQVETNFETNLKQDETSFETDLQEAETNLETSLKQDETSNLFQLKTKLTQTETRLKESDSEIEVLIIELGESKNLIKSLKEKLTQALTMAESQQIPEGYKVYSPQKQAEIEHNYNTALNNAVILQNENNELTRQIRDFVQFDDTHTAAALSKMAADIAKGSRMPFYTITQPSIINLFLRYYKIELTNAKVSPALR